MENNEKLFEVGELVRFTAGYTPGLIWPPSYILGQAYISQHRHDLGIIVSDIEGVFKGKSFKVYWFRTRLITETFATHLMHVN
jgi:hypothetical protein